MIIRTLVALGAATLTLTACASAPEVKVPVLPLHSSQPVSFNVAGMASTDETEADRAVERLLEARGWRAGDGRSDWRVSTAYSVRPQTVGGFSDASASETAWVAEPVLPQSWDRKLLIHTLVVTLTTPEGDHGVYQATASLKTRDKRPEFVLGVLAEALVAALEPAS